MRQIPDHFLQGEDAFRAKVLWVFSTVLGGVGLIVLLFLSLAEGVPARRLVTVVLAVMLLGVSVCMRYATRLGLISIYVCLVTTALMFYVDFNNLSVSGPTTILWVVPFLLMALLFSGVRLLLFMALAFSLFIFNIFAFEKGWLPEPIIKPVNWHYVQIIFVLCTAIMITVCTRGMWSLSNMHLQNLEIELKQKQDRIQQMSELKLQAESSTRSKSIFLANMSHELRTPLNSVIGNSQLLVRSDLPEKHRVKINDIALAGNLLLMLINDILDFSKLEQNELVLIEEPYDLTLQILELSRMMMPKLKKGVELILPSVESNVHIKADKNRVSQVLMNLLSNAMKFTDSGVITISLVELENNGIKISISDTGIGIKEEDVKKLFTEFSQVTHDSTRNMEGTGLGLAISLGLVQHMGGTIDVSSELDRGSCFSVLLPYKRVAALPIESVTGSESRDVTLSLQGCSILVVDDIEMNCMVLEGMLLDYGADNVLSLNSGEQAISHIKKNMQTRLVLMDMRMPGMSGVVATEKIRAMGFQGSIIAVTANASEQDRQACITSGMNGFISKPVDMLELENVLFEILKKK
ncbi:MAG: signal transduction histidine kinase/CheY-like chemotaxis protein [Oceanicoccus sp.]|jgi:signal transduction histidine kinase/CheY-like chemotaxis protein